MAARTARIGWVGLVAGLLIVVQLVVRGVLAFRGYFYWCRRAPGSLIRDIIVFVAVPLDEPLGERRLAGGVG